MNLLSDVVGVIKQGKIVLDVNLSKIFTDSKLAFNF